MSESPFPWLRKQEPPLPATGGMLESLCRKIIGYKLATQGNPYPISFRYQQKLHSMGLMKNGKVNVKLHYKQ